MKPFLNSSLTIVLLFIVGNLFFSSCHKDNNDPVTASIPLIASISYYQNDGTLDSHLSLQHDTQGRLIKIIEDNGYSSTVKYSIEHITMMSYQDGNLNETLNMLLNNKGLVTSFSLDDASELGTIEYDNNNYRKSIINEGNNYESSTTYTVADGNYVTTHYSYTSKTTKSVSVKEVDFLKRSAIWSNLTKRITSQNRIISASMDNTERINYLFYKDKISTIDFENMGISFEGKQNKNPIKQSSSNYFSQGSGIESIDIINYTYEYDSKGRITKQIADNGDYSVFTYID